MKLELNNSLSVNLNNRQIMKTGLLLCWYHSFEDDSGKPATLKITRDEREVLLNIMRQIDKQTDNSLFTRIEEPH